MLIIKNGFEYRTSPYGVITYIPAGVPVVLADNLSDNNLHQYWVKPWEGMSEKAEAWNRNYGFLVDASQVAESPFALGQRVRILPCGSWPAVKNVRYGIIHGATQFPGMALVNEDGRQSAAGEWAFIVALYRSPNAGAMWFSAKGLQPMKREQKTSVPDPIPEPVKTGGMSRDQALAAIEAIKAAGIEAIDPSDLDKPFSL